MDVRFKTPANFYVCRQTQAGKSHLTRHMLRHLEELFYPVPTKIIYCYGEYQKNFDELPPYVELMEGFPDNLNNMVCGHDHCLVVLDDLMSQCSNQGWKMYRTTGPLVPENFWGCQKIFWQGGLPQFSRIIVVYVTNKGHIHRYICNPIKPHAMTIYRFMFHAQMYCSLIFDRV